MLLKWCEGKFVRFITLTLRQTDEPLKTVLDTLLSSYKRLRNQKIWKKNVTAAVGVVEIKKGRDGRRWNVHLHVLCTGFFLAQKDLSDAWRLASGGSFVVDVRAVRDHAVGVGYVAKYATKGWASEVAADQDALLECIVSLRGRRLFITSGGWYGRDEDVEQDQYSDWKLVGYLGKIYADSLDGKIYATNCLANLGLACGSVNGDPVFIGCEQDWSGP